MSVAHGRAETAHARRYMTQLAKHWSHKFQVRYDDASADISLPLGACRMKAQPDRLEIELECSNPDQFGRMKEVVVEHLKRFAFREPFEVTWS